MAGADGGAGPGARDVVAKAPHLARATLVLLTSMTSSSCIPTCSRTTTSRTNGGARDSHAERPFELGVALTAYPRRTIIVEIGKMPPFTIWQA